jgi:hypothetical protein
VRKRTVTEAIHTGSFFSLLSFGNNDENIGNDTYEVKDACEY